MNTKSTRDSLYATKQDKVSDFIFDESVADVFDDMIKRSVPGYTAIINMIGVLAQQYAQQGSSCYDLGCSLGAGTLAMQKRIDQPLVKIIAVDNSKAMTEQCRKNVEQSASKVPVEIMRADIQDVAIRQASVVVINFTLQFLNPKARAAMIQKIYDGMLSGGVLIVSEKISFESEQEQQFQEQMHHTFKKLNGYSDLEISQKRTALEKVLVPDTLQEHQQRLETAGFKKFTVWFQCFNFASMVVSKQ